MVKRSNEAGFTMIEVMVAMLITAIALIGILALFMTQTKASGFSRHSTEATALCQDKLEQLRTMTAASIGTTGSQTNIDSNGSNGGVYSRSWTWTNYTSYVDLLCTASWTEDEGGGSGSGKSVSIHAWRQP